MTVKKHIQLIVRGLRIFASFPTPTLTARTVSSVANAITPFVNIYFSAQILNELTGTRDMNRLTTLVLLTVGLNLLVALIKSLAARWSAYCDGPSWFSMFQVLARKSYSLDYADTENPEIQQQYSEIRQHQTGMGFGLPRLLYQYNDMITGLMQTLVSVAMAFSLFTLKVPEGSPYAFLDSPAAVAAVLTVLAASVLVSPYLSLVGGKIWAKASVLNNKSNRIFKHYFFEMIGENERAKDIRMYNQKRLINSHVDGYFNDNVDEWFAFNRYNARFNALGTGITYLANGLIYLYVALKALSGAFGVGSIVQYVGAITQFGGGFSMLLTTFGLLANNNPFLEKVFAFLDLPNKKYQGTLSVEKRDDNKYAIAFKNVSFKYPGTDEYALKDVNLTFNIGRRMAVVGMNGGGKTTMIKLLCRLYDPTEGVITLNGIDIKKYNYDEYMALFSVVFQDFKLLPFTLGQNVAAAVSYDRDKVERALALTGFDIVPGCMGEQRGSATSPSHMPAGTDTYLYKNFEESGVEVSGGEAQKIALARALYRNAPFIVLDEPTAALDPIAEYEIYSKFNHIAGDKTAVYISHRLASCRFCDEIAVFHEGHMVQRGSHDTLLNDKEGKYYELWEAQAQYYKTQA